MFEDENFLLGRRSLDALRLRIICDVIKPPQQFMILGQLFDLTWPVSADGVNEPGGSISADGTIDRGNEIWKRGNLIAVDSEMHGEFPWLSPRSIDRR